MLTVHCDCGEPIHYSVDKVGLTARCRCGRTVRLVEPRQKRGHRHHHHHHRPPTQEELFQQQERAADVRRQVIAVIAAVVVLIALVFAVVRSSSPTGQSRKQTPVSESQ